MDFVLYHPRTRKTGRRIAQYLGVPHGTEYPKENDRPEFLIRWGSAVAVPFKPEIRTINKRLAVSLSTDKIATFATLKRAAVPVPHWGEALEGLGLPAVARTNHTQGGKNIRLILQPGDTAALDFTPDFYTKYIPKHKEFRVHVINGTRIKVQEKVFRGEPAQYDPVVWNHDNGWVFIHPTEPHPGLAQAITAVNALGLDFGAVDLVISKDDEPYILEVNTAPGLIRDNLILYGDAIARMLGRTDYPGIDAITDWEPDEE